MFQMIFEYVYVYFKCTCMCICVCVCYECFHFDDMCVSVLCDIFHNFFFFKYFPYLHNINVRLNYTHLNRKIMLKTFHPANREKKDRLQFHGARVFH